MAGAAVAHGRASPVCVTTLPGRVAGVGLRAQAQGHFPEDRAEIWCIILILFRSSSFQSDTIQPRDLQKLNCCACCAFETFKPTRRHRPNSSWRFMGILTWDVSRTARREVIICNRSWGTWSPSDNYRRLLGICRMDRGIYFRILPLRNLFPQK